MKIALPIALAVTLVSSAAMAQTTTTPPATSPPTATPAPPAARAPAMVPADGSTLTDEQANAWIDKTIYSSDDKNVGEVAEFRRDSSGKITELHADVGGFLGLGETRVKLEPAQFKFGDDRVILKVTAEQVKSLPKIEK